MRRPRSLPLRAGAAARASLPPTQGEKQEGGDMRLRSFFPLSARCLSHEEERGSRDGRTRYSGSEVLRRRSSLPLQRERARLELACVTAWLGRALAACGISATLLFGAVAFAGDAVERALTLVSQERYAEARKVLEPFLEREPNAPRLRLLQGILEVHEGNTREAVAIFERLRSDYPDMFEPHNNLAVLHAREGRLDAARDALVAALQRERDAVAYANLGDVYMRLADRAYSRAREAGSADGSASEGPAPQTKSSVVAAAKDRTCVRAGGFKDRAVAEEAAAWLRSRDAEAVEVRQEERRLVTSHRVYLPALPSVAAAKTKLREIRGRGIRDAAIFGKGARANAISLGVYRSEENARRRVARLKKLGYAVKSEPNMKTMSEYVLVARAGGDRSAFKEAWAAKFPGHAISDVACP